MKPWEKYGQTDQPAGPWSKYAQQPAQPAAEPEPQAGQMPGALRALGNLGAGAIRGAGSIGATLLAPVDIASDLLAGRDWMTSNRGRREDITNALQNLGFNTDSMSFGAGKLGGEIAGTLGTGGVVANALTRFAPRLAGTPIVSAIESAGMSAPGAGLGTRAAGGAVTGAASAGLVNPEDAAAGAAFGAGTPVATKFAGYAGNAIGRVINGPAQPADLTQAIQAARGAGYVIPPSQAKPSLVNRVMEGTAGKITTAQNASARNAVVTNRLVAESLGLPGDTKLTPELLNDLRAQAGRAYREIGSTGVITPGDAYAEALDKIAQPFRLTAEAFPGANPSPVLSLVESLKSPAFASASAVEKIKQLRDAASDAFRRGDTDVGRASRAAAKALEDAVEEHLQKIGQPELLNKFRQNRELIAKTYSVESAMNPTTGAIDARKLGKQIEKGKPLTGKLREAGEFANRFPKAAQMVEGMGSLPQISPLDAYGSGGASILAGVMTGGNPLSLLPLAIPAARVGSRAAALSGPVQNRLAVPPVNALASDPVLAPLFYRAAPVLGASL